MRKWIPSLFLVALLVSVTGCACGSVMGPVLKSTPVPTAVPDGSDLTEQSAEGPMPVGLPPLPPDPQRIEFQAEDGQVLVGTYYPAAVNPAPLVVLMHWSRSDKSDWVAIAAWLQNRGQEVEPGDVPWLTPGWFPPMLEGQSFAVFAFTFRNCEGGCSSFARAGRLLDAKAAMRTASELDGVDPQRLATIGASIGADGAVDACEEGCLGVLSLSPGSYLTVDYAGAVAAVDGAGKPAWCLAAEGDRNSAQACESASGDRYRMEMYLGTDHGMELIKPDMEPNTLELVLEFLQLVFEVSPQ
jgi:dienelactone hydrolase